MLTIGTCRVCGTGPLGLRRCGTCRRVVVLCDECDAAWSSADTSSKPTYATEEDMPCPCCGATLLTRGSRWATSDEAKALPGIERAELDHGDLSEPTAGS